MFFSLCIQAPGSEYSRPALEVDAKCNTAVNRRGHGAVHYLFPSLSLPRSLSAITPSSTTTTIPPLRPSPPPTPLVFLFLHLVFPPLSSRFHFSRDLILVLLCSRPPRSSSSFWHCSSFLLSLFVSSSRFLRFPLPFTLAFSCSTFSSFLFSYFASGVLRFTSPALYVCISLSVCLTVLSSHLSDCFCVISVSFCTCLCLSVCLYFC